MLHNQKRASRSTRPLSCTIGSCPGTAPLASVGLDWQLGGFAPTASNGFIGINSNFVFISFPQALPVDLNHALNPIASLVSTLSGQSRRITATETLPQSVRYSIQPIVRDPFERPVPPLRRMSGERSAFNV
jgi:hypothetical protein